MKIERAIEILKERGKFVADINIDAKTTYKIAMEALEKQIPKKPKVMNTTLVGEKFWWYCGHCGASRHTGSKSNYCGYCGGKVDWEVENEN